MRALFLVATLFLALFLAPLPARAEDDALKRQADELVANRNYEEAVRVYDQAYAKAPLPAILYNKGRALQFLGRYPEALASFERFAKEAPPDVLAKVPGLDGLLAEVRAKVGRLEVRCAVAGARVLVRDTVVGKTPLPGAIALSAGKATVEIAADGYQTWRREVDLPGGGLLALDVELVARAASGARASERGGTLAVSSRVDGAKVMIDDKPLGAAPVDAPVGPGLHRVRVSRDGFDDAEAEVAVEDGTRRELSLSPTSRAAMTSRWWFWAGVGAVVVGGVVLTAALLTEKPGTSGDFSPGRTTAPLLRF